MYIVESQWASEARLWKPYRTYRNRHRRAYSTHCGLRSDIGLLPQWTSSSLISSSPSGQKLQFLLKLSQWIPSSLRRQIVEVLSNLPQQTSSSLLYTLRAPPRYWIATAMDIVEPQRPDSGQHVGIESDCRGRCGTIVINESGEEKDNKINKHESAEAKSQPTTSSGSLVVEERSRE